MHVSSSTREKLFYITGIVTLFLLVLYRAFCLDITFDEVYTIDLASQPIRDIFFNERNFQSANNHILNSILIKPFIFLFGKKMIAIRLPNVIASLFFFIGNMQLSKKLCSTTLSRCSAFIILSLNLYLLDFFSLSRGYGLALMFEVWSLYFFFHFLQKNTLRYNGLSFLFAALAVLSNFTWINFYLPLWCTLNLIFFLHEKSVARWLKINLSPTLIAIALCTLCYIPISYLKDADEFRWGASDWWSSMHGLTSNLLYSNHERLIRWTEYILALIFCIGLFSTIRYIYRKKTVNDSSPSEKQILCIVLLLSFILLSSLAQHQFLHTMFMDGRKATMYATLIFCLGILTLKKIRVPLIMTILASYSVLSFIFHINPKSVREWYLDAYVTEALLEMKNQTDQALTITCSWELQTPLQFYNRYVEEEKLLLHKVEKKGDDFGDHFWLINSCDLDKLPSDCRQIRRFDNQTFLFMLN